MRLLIIITCLCTSYVNAVAQETFFNFVDGWINMHSVETDTGYELWGLESTGTSPFDHGFMFNEIDLDGNLNNQFSFSVDTAFTTTSRDKSYMSLMVGANQYFAGTLGTGSGQVNYMGALYVKYANGDTELLRVFDEDVYVNLYCIEKKDEGTLLLASFVTDGVENKRLMVHQTDLLGNIEWTYTTPSCGEYCSPYPQQVLQLSNGNIAVLFREYYNQGALGYHEQAVLVMLNQNGLELWREYPGDEEGHRLWPGGMVELDGELLVSYTDPYYYDGGGNAMINYSSSIYFETYNLEGVLLTTFNLSGEIPDGNSEEDSGVFHSVSQLQLLQDGGLVFSGHTGFHGFIGKLDQELELNWYRLHAPHAVEDNFVFQHTHIYHTLPTSDGGFLCTGQYESDPGDLYPQGIQTAIALKVDEYGCLEPGCQIVDDIPEYEQRRMQVWPNPASSDLNVRLPESVQAEKVILLDALGRIQELRSDINGTAHLQVSLSSLQLPHGLYTLILTSRDGRVFTEKVVFE